jgi:hypothetical protein
VVSCWDTWCWNNNGVARMAVLQFVCFHVGYVWWAKPSFAKDRLIAVLMWIMEPNCSRSCRAVVQNTEIYTILILLLEPCISLIYVWKPTNTPIIHSVYYLCMVAPTCFGITLPSSGSVPSALWETLNCGAVDRILWMGVLCLVTWCVVIWDRHVLRH